MKRFFLYAVAISALCSSCESEDEIFANNTNTPTNALRQSKDTQTNDYDTYQSIMNSFEYNKQEPYNENLLRFEEHVNRRMRNYELQEVYKYEKINIEELLVLQQVDADYIEKLVYTKPTKQAIYALVSNRFNNDMMQLITNESERNLTETLLSLHNNGNGNDGDIWNGNKTIAFAYGAQYNLTQAILYAGAIELGNAYKVK